MKKIVLIEDDIVIQKIYSHKLEIDGYKVILALSADQGFGLISKEIPDLVLLDIMLPGKMNGFDLLEMLKKNAKLKKIPVIVITNLDNEKTQALKVGAMDYLIKSNTDITQLSQMVKKYI